MSEVKRKKKSKKSNRNKIVAFDEEIITKDKADEILKTQPEIHLELESEVPFESIVESTTTKKRRKQKTPKVQDEPPEAPPEKKKKKREKKPTPPETTPETPDEQPVTKEKPESIRERKRKKHAQLVQDKKQQSERASQTTALNYLSLWVHNRNEWKFQKLRQNWLMDHMYQSAYVPDEFWDNLVQYFCGSTGGVRTALIKKALSVVRTEEKVKGDEPEEGEEQDQNMLKRAKDILQHLESVDDKVMDYLPEL